MNFKKQVDRSHYEFEKYMPIHRWCSVWHQLQLINQLNPENILEVGPGLGFLKALGPVTGFKIETIDIDPELNPDHIGSATNLPFADLSYDLVCAFQMLEHLPYESSLQAFREMVRVSKRNVVISLPDVKTGFRFHANLSLIGGYDISIANPVFIADNHQFDGEHYWEVNKRNYPLKKIIQDLSLSARLIRTFRAPEIPFHRFFVFERV